jgi:hypothetical protein
VPGLEDLGVAVRSLEAVRVDHETITGSGGHDGLISPH